MREVTTQGTFWDTNEEFSRNFRGIAKIFQRYSREIPKESRGILQDTYFFSWYPSICVYNSVLPDIWSYIYSHINYMLYRSFCVGILLCTTVYIICTSLSRFHQYICMHIFNNKNICWVKGIVRALQQKYISLTQNASVENW